VSTPFEESRRLTGPNLCFGACGAVLEAPLPGGGEAAALTCWEGLITQMRQSLGWTRGPVVARTHASGATLAFAAPEDQLFTATEVNEWAWQRALEATTTLVFPRPFAPGHPAVGDPTSAAATLAAMAADEARPALMALLEAARKRNLPAYLGEGLVSLGAGKGHQTWPIDAPPPPEQVPWSRLHDIPTVLVTGSNGKTTTTRLLAAMAAAQGWAPGFTCTDGISVAGAILETGDYSGPMGARAVLRDARVEAAILETARGGILRRGLAVAQTAVAIITNVSPDHFGEYGIHTLEDLAKAKLVVARAVAPGGLLVLNADDPLLVAHGRGPGCALGWFSLDADHPRLREHRRLGGATCGVQAGHLSLAWKGTVHDLGAVAAMPLSAGGHAAYNISNLAGAALAAAALGIAPAAIARVLATFGAAHGDNPGRLESWRFGGLTLFMDYAHNPEGLAGLLTVAVASRHTGRLGLVLGQAGNREDEAIRQLADAAARFQPDQVVLKDLDGYLRGRVPGEVPELLRQELEAEGVPADRMQVVLPEEQAVLALLTWARPGDVLVLPVHAQVARDAVRARLDRLEATGWVAGAPLP